ncbi:hypothetical protein BKN38_01005 [Helicobacter sp. CLO-3]|nr:hypothetical protein BA723_06600 [Helicobacter sp. CLO-3]OHU85628.1 hypothetical protein BKN38_01005 [Helicobacter sp. CLO-3]
MHREIYTESKSRTAQNLIFRHCEDSANPKQSRESKIRRDFCVNRDKRRASAEPRFCIDFASQNLCRIQNLPRKFSTNKFSIALNLRISIHLIIKPKIFAQACILIKSLESRFALRARFYLTKNPYTFLA